jgi:hypothetical protein
MLNKKQEKTATSPSSTLFVSSLMSVMLARRLYPNIKTLDLSYFILARAVDVYAQKAYYSDIVRKRVPSWMLEFGNVIVFMLASTEIIFSWFYEPERLPRYYICVMLYSNNIKIILLQDHMKNGLQKCQV